MSGAKSGFALPEGSLRPKNLLSATRICCYTTNHQSATFRTGYGSQPVPSPAWLWVAAPPGALLPSWLLDAHGHALANQLGRLRKLPYDDAKSYVITCTQQPGTAVYLPEGWSRATVSLGDTVALVQQHQHEQQRQKEAAGLLQGSS